MLEVDTEGFRVHLYLATGDHISVCNLQVTIVKYNAKRKHNIVP